MKVQHFVSWLPLFFVGLATAISLRSFCYPYPTSLKKLSLLWVINFCVDLAGHITKHLDIKNHWLYNIYFWLLYLSLAYLYYPQIQSKYVRTVINIFYVAFPLLVITECIVTGIKQLQTPIIVAGGSFIIFLAAAYFKQLYQSNESERISLDPWFWFSFGFIIHFGGTLPFLGMLNYLWEYYKEFTNFYYLYFSNSFTILLNILIIVGFLCRTNYQKSP